MTNTKEQAVWKTFPDYPFIEANQFGEIRTIDRVVTCSNGKQYFVKGRVLKQQRDHNGYMTVHFRMSGKQVVLLVHRVIATCFIPNPDNLPEVNHKDNNPKNNAVSNLEWCDRQYNIDYKKNFGTTSAEVQGKQVFAANLRTGKVLRFETQSGAARQLGVNREDINKVIKGRLNQAGGYLFTEDESEITEEKIREVKDKMVSLDGVIVINPETSEVFWFKSQREAAYQLGVDPGNISKVIKGYYNKTGGYWFCRADENAVEKTRAKFGDEIANKVKELM